MTMREVVTKLQSDGHRVKYSVRKDGGIRITNIDGVSYKGSTGNTIARGMTGQTLSVRRTAQLKTIRSQKGQWGHRKRVTPLPDEIVKRIRRVQRKFRQEGINRTGIVTQRNYRYVLKHYGEEEALRRLSQAERYASGLAYYENVDALIKRIAMDIAKKRDPYMENLIEKINNKIATFKEKWINQIYEILYMWEKGQITGQSAAAKIEEIMA